MRNRLLYFGLMIIMAASMTVFSGCIDTSHLAGSASTAIEEDNEATPETESEEAEELEEAEEAEVEALAAEAASVEYEEMVWIPRTGSKYHSNPDCSRMRDPSHVTLSEAERRGYDPCSKCY